MTENNNGISILKEIIETKIISGYDVDAEINRMLQRGWIILSIADGADSDNYPMHSVLLGFTG
ncbi:hypothetical protein [Xenorhabdus bovienii]|uniref:hypothetical protein n=1 Tax=Xenorhabdus bovienii TaxID=40576 RepID=UPI0005708775|nr:hypothetical protein [Xenorhabdus bovienii]